MPRIHTRKLKQKAVLWAFSSYDNYGGVRVSAAAEILVRWEEEPREVVGPEGSPIMIDGTVFAKQEIAPGSLIRLGAKRDLPATPDNLMEVLSCTEIPSIKGDRSRYHRACTVRKYNRNSLPTVV